MCGYSYDFHATCYCKIPGSQTQSDKAHAPKMHALWARAIVKTMSTRRSPYTNTTKSPWSWLSFDIRFFNCDENHNNYGQNKCDSSF